MKTKTDKRPFHLNLEYFFRHQYCLLIMLGLLTIAVLKSDGKLFGVMREAYAQGFGMVGQYMREETTRVPVTFDISARIPTVSGR